MGTFITKVLQSLIVVVKTHAVVSGIVVVTTVGSVYLVRQNSRTDAVVSGDGSLQEVAVSDEAGRLRMKVQGVGEKAGAKGAESSGAGEKNKALEAFKNVAQEVEEKKGNEAEKEEPAQEEVSEEKQPEEVKNESLESDGENTDASSDVSGSDVFSSSSSDAGGEQLSFEQGNDEKMEQQELAEEREKLDLQRQELEEKQKKLDQLQSELEKKEELNEEEKRRLEDLKKEQDALDKEKEDLDKKEENLNKENEIEKDEIENKEEQIENKEENEIEEDEKKIENKEEIEKKNENEIEENEGDQFKNKDENEIENKEEVEKKNENEIEEKEEKIEKKIENKEEIEKKEKKDENEIEKKDEKKEGKKEEPRVEEKRDSLNEEKLNFEKDEKGEGYKDSIANNKGKVNTGVLKMAPPVPPNVKEHHEESAEDRRKRLIEKLNDQFAKEQDYEVEDECYDVFASQEIVGLAAGSECKVKTLTLKWKPNDKDLNRVKENLFTTLRNVVSRENRNPNLRLCVLCGAGLMDKWEEADGIVVEVQPGRNDMERKYGGNLLIAFKDKEPEVVPEKPEDKGKERVEGRVYSFEIDKNGFFLDKKLISDLKRKVLNGKSFVNMLLQRNATAEGEKMGPWSLYESFENPEPLIELSADEMASGKGMVFVVRGKHDIDGKDRRFLIRDHDSRKIGRISTIFVLDDGRLTKSQADYFKELVASDKLADENGLFFVSYIPLLCDCLERKLLLGSDIIGILNRHNEMWPGKQVSMVVLEDQDEIPGLLPSDIREAKGISFATDNEKFKKKCEEDGLRIVDTGAGGEWEISVPQKITVELSDRSEEEEKEERGSATGSDRFGKNEYEKILDLEDILLKLPETEWYKKQREEYVKEGGNFSEEERKTYLSNFSVDFDFEQRGVGSPLYYGQLFYLSKEAMKTIRYFIIPALPGGVDNDRASFVRDLVVRGWYFPDENGLQNALDGKEFRVQYTGGTTKCVLTPYLTGLCYSNEEIYKDLGEKADDYVYKYGKYEMLLQCRQTESMLRLPLIFAYAYTNEMGGLKDDQYITRHLSLTDVPEGVQKRIKDIVGEDDKGSVEVLDAVCFYREELYTGGQGKGSRNYFLHPWLIDKMFQSSEGLCDRRNPKCDRLVPGTTFIYDVNGEDISANRESEVQGSAGIRALDDTFGKPYGFSYHNSPTFDYCMSGDNCWFRIEKTDARAWFVSFYDPNAAVGGKNDQNQEFNKKKKCIAIRWTFKSLRYKDGDEEKDTPEAESYQKANKIPALIPQFSEKLVTEEARKSAEEYMELFRAWQAMDELKRSFAEGKAWHEVSFEVLSLISLEGIRDAILSEDSKVKSLRIYYSDEEWMPEAELEHFLRCICGVCEKNNAAIIEDVNIDTEDVVSFCRVFNKGSASGNFCILPVGGKVVRFAPYSDWIEWLKNNPSEEEEEKWANAEERLKALLEDSDAYKAYVENPVNRGVFDFRRIDLGIDPELLLKMPDELLKGFSYFIIPGVPKDVDGDSPWIEERKRFVKRLILNGWKFNEVYIKIAESGGGDEGREPVWYFPDRPIEEAMNGEVFTVQYTGGTTKCILTPYLTGLCYSKDEIFKALGETQEDFTSTGAICRFEWRTMSNISRPLIFAYDAVNDRVMGDDLQYISDCMDCGVLPDGVKAKIRDFFGQEESKISKLSEEELQVLDAVCFYDGQLYANKGNPGTRNYFLHTWLIDKMFRSSIIGSPKWDTIVKGKTFVYTEDGVDISKKGYNDHQKDAGIEIVDDTFGRPYDFSYHSVNNGEYVAYGLSANGCVFAIRKSDAKAWFVSFYDPNDTYATDRNDEFNRKKKCIAIRWTFKPLKQNGRTYTPEVDSYCMANSISGLLPQFPEKQVTEEARKGAEEYMKLFRGWRAMDELKRSFAEEKAQHEVSLEVLRLIGLEGLVDAILSKDSKVKSLRIQYSNDGHRHISKRYLADLAGFLHRICEACKERQTAIIKDVNIDTDDVVSFCRVFNKDKVWGDDFTILPVEGDKDVVRFASCRELIGWKYGDSLKKEEANDEGYFSAGEQEEEHEEDEEQKEEEEGDEKFEDPHEALMAILEGELSKEERIKEFKEGYAYDDFKKNARDSEESEAFNQKYKERVDRDFDEFTGGLSERFRDFACFRGVKRDVSGELQWEDAMSFVMNEAVEKDLLKGGSRFIERCMPRLKDVFRQCQEGNASAVKSHQHILYYCMNGDLSPEKTDAEIINGGLNEYGALIDNPGGGDCGVWSIRNSLALKEGNDEEAIGALDENPGEMQNLRNGAADMFINDMRNNTVKERDKNFPLQWVAGYRSVVTAWEDLEKKVVEGGASEGEAKKKKDEVDKFEEKYTVDNFAQRIRIKGQSLFSEDFGCFSKYLNRTILIYEENGGQVTLAFPDGAYYQSGCLFLKELFTETQAERLIMVFMQKCADEKAETHYQTITERGRKVLFDHLGYRRENMHEALAALCPNEDTTIDLTNFSTTETVEGKEVGRPKGDDDRSLKARILFESDRKEFVLACFGDKNVVRLVLPAYAHVKGGLLDALKEALAIEDLSSLRLYFRNNGFYGPDEIFPSDEEINRLNGVFGNGNRHLVSEEDENGANYLRFENDTELK